MELRYIIKFILHFILSPISSFSKYLIKDLSLNKTAKDYQLSRSKRIMNMSIIKFHITMNNRPFLIFSWNHKM